MYKTILVPVDVYETALSDKALQHAQLTSVRLLWDRVIPIFKPIY